ncbi:MAG TPA: hypothetical protein VF432_21735, partial [Thermoanaerobaculia bacterium]
PGPSLDARDDRRTLRSGTLVFVAHVADNWELFALRADDTAPQRLTTTPLDERAPALSPDGSRVAYATSDGALWVRELAAGEAVRLELPAGIYGYPAWLPDGSGIVYTSYEYDPPHEDADLFVYDFATRRAKLFLLQTGPQDYAALSPAGDRVAYMSSLATALPGFGSTVTQQLWMVALQTGTPSLLLGDARSTTPAWSKDGATLAFSSDRSGPTEIWLLHVESKALTQLTSGAGAKRSPAWSPDGSEIAYVSTASGRAELEIVEVKTRRVRHLPLGLDVRDPDWR